MRFYPPKYPYKRHSPIHFCPWATILSNFTNRKWKPRASKWQGNRVKHVSTLGICNIWSWKIRILFQSIRLWSQEERQSTLWPSSKTKPSGKTWRIKWKALHQRELLAVRGTLKIKYTHGPITAQLRRFVNLLLHQLCSKQDFNNSSRLNSSLLRKWSITVSQLWIIK